MSYNSFKTVFKFPLKLSSACPEIKVLTADGHMAFDWLFSTETNFKQEILSVLNGEKEKLENSPLENLIFDHSRFNIYSYDKNNKRRIPVLKIRGWGYLTADSPAGLNLPIGLAENLSIDFAHFIIEKIISEVKENNTRASNSSKINPQVKI